MGSAEWKARGNAALAANDLAEAGRCYEAGLAADGTDAALRLNLGFVLLEQGQFPAAAERLQQALALRAPSDTFAHEAHYLLGRAYAALGRLEAAEASFSAALKAAPEFVEALGESARVQQLLGRHAEAAERARMLVQLQPSTFSRLLLANALLRSGKPGEACPLLAQVCAEEPGNLEASGLYFDALLQAGSLAEALAEAQRALALAGPLPAIRVNLSVVLERMGRLEEALAQLEEALRQEPRRRDALVNRVTVLTGLVRVQEAVAAAEAALHIYPEDPDLHWLLCIAHLTLGQFSQGWREHEWRHRSVAFRGSLLKFEQPRWQGESLAGKAIFLYGEQGFGDNIQFVRFVPVIAQQAAQVYLQVLEPLEPLMSELPANCRLLGQGALLPAIDFHCPLMSLPAVLGTTESDIPATVPYLRADTQRVQRWRERLPQDTFNVGIAWSGKPSHVNDRNRSMALSAFREIATDGCTFVTLQPQLPQGDRAELDAWPHALDLGREVKNFADSAALAQALDLVVAVDTSVAHLAGALARPVWVLLPHCPDWRWMLQRDDSPWYPTARLYRQPVAGDWGSVLAKVRSDLGALVRATDSAAVHANGPVRVGR